MNSFVRLAGARPTPPRPFVAHSSARRASGGKRDDLVKWVCARTADLEPPQAPHSDRPSYCFSGQRLFPPTLSAPNRRASPGNDVSVKCSIRKWM